jgi:hypothetical protein
MELMRERNVSSEASTPEQQRRVFQPRDRSADPLVVVFAHQAGR